MASGTSAPLVSRIGLPLSSVSARARSSRFSSMRSATLLRSNDRSAGDMRAQASLALWAASSVISRGRLRDIDQALAIDRAVIGKILAISGCYPVAADEVAVAGGNLSFRADEIESVLRHVVFLFPRIGGAALKPPLSQHRTLIQRS